MQAVDGDLLLRPGLRVVATPGHTPGHQSVVLESESNQVLITGDLLASVVQLINPEITYLHDMDPDQARQTRIATLRELRRQAVHGRGNVGSSANSILLANSPAQVVAAMRRAKVECRVLERGVSVSQASMRWRLMATAVSTWPRWVLA